MEKRDSEKKHQMWHETTHTQEYGENTWYPQKRYQPEREEGDKTQSDLGSD